LTSAPEQLPKSSAPSGAAVALQRSSPRASPRASPRLAAALACPDFSLPEALPELMVEVDKEERCEILQAVRDLGARLNRLLVAPNIAALADELREVDRTERRVLIEALPEETQVALQEHMLAERRAAVAGVQVHQSTGAEGSGSTGEGTCCGRAIELPQERPRSYFPFR